MESKNNITNIYEEANELKKTINVSTENLMINLSNIFNATKIDKNIKSENVDLNESMDSMANEINTLLNIVNKLKIKEFKNYEQKNKEDFEMFLQRKAMENKNYKNKIKKLEDLYQNISNTLVDLKKSEYYPLIKKLEGLISK